MSKDWITIEELLQLTGWDRSTAFRKQANGELRTRLVGAAANGKRSREYDLRDLPAEAQAKRMQQLIASPLQQAAAPPRLMRALSSLDEDSQKQARQRLDAISPIIEFVNTGQEPLCAGVRVTNISGIVKHLSATLGHSERTLWNWWNAYNNGGPGALADKPRKDFNTSRFFTKHTEAARFASNKFLNERLSITMVHEAMLRDWPRLRLDADDIPPCFDTVRQFLNGLPPVITAIAHGGERAYKDNFAPYLLRDRSKVRANQFWISDHMLHDVWVRNVDEETQRPLFSEKALNEAFRPWLTAIQDMKSRRILAMVWCANPSSNSISSALRSALECYGRPESAFYVDNGKDYNKVSDDACGVLTRLGVRTQHCIPRHPQAKQIESFFHTLHQRFDTIWRPFYAGISPKHRPEDCDQELDKHKRLLAAGQGHKSGLPPASFFIRLAQQWLLEDFNNSFVDRARGVAGMTPVQIFDADLPLDQRQPLKAADMGQLFWNRERRIVREGGTVQLFNARYEPADAEAAAALTLNIQREILVACDPLNVGEAIALTLDEQFLGVLRAQELLVHGATPVDAIRASMRNRRNAFKAVKRYLGALEQSRVAAGDLSEIEALEKRAVGSSRPAIYTLPAPKTINSAPQKRMYVDDIADLVLAEEG